MGNVAGAFIPPRDMTKEFSEKDALALESMAKQMIAEEKNPDNQDITLPGTPLEMAQKAIEQVRKLETTRDKDGKPTPPDRYTLG